MPRTKEEEDFIRQYAVEIAKALKEQDESPKQPKVEETVPALYRALCFDEPIIDSTDIPNLSVTSSALVRQLTTTSPTKKFALSNRLVNGILYMCQQQGNKRTNAKDNGNVPPSSTTTTSEASPLGLARLALAAFIQVPLECCEDLENLTRVRNLLGSYKSAMLPKSNDAAHGNLNDAAADQRIEQVTAALAGDTTTTTNDNFTANDTTDDSSLQEVWAAESDPSDYDYGEGISETATLTTALNDFHVTEDLLDPLVLSRADPHLTLEQAKASIAALLQQANYTLLEPIFTISKKDDIELYLSQLTQLLLMLLQPGKMTLLDTGGGESSIQDATLTPLWILRDAALHHSPTALTSSATSPSAQQKLFTTAYMDALQTLLAIDQAHESDRNASSQVRAEEDSLCSASIVGLSALSSWCSSAQISMSLTTNAILDSMNDLAHVLERASMSGYKENLYHSVVPIFEVLSGVTFSDGRRAGRISNPAVAQTLMSSGLLRHLLLLVLDQKDKAEGVTSHQQYVLGHTLLGLCLSYPTVIGKYVMRYPGMARFIRHQYRMVAKEAPTSLHCTQAFLWNLYAYSTLSEGAAVPRVVWKSKSSEASDPPLTAEECQEVCLKAWSCLCQMVEESLQESAPGTATEKEGKKGLQVLEDWKQLLDHLTQFPSMATIVLDLLQEHKVQLEGIRRKLQERANDVDATVGSQVPVEDRPTKDGEDSDDDGKKTSLTNPQLVVARSRKLLKEYTLFFQGSARGSSKTD